MATRLRSITRCPAVKSAGRRPPDGPGGGTSASADRGRRARELVGELGPRPHAELAVDVAEVELDRLRREEQRRGRLAVRRAARDEHGDLQLARRQLAGLRAARAAALAGGRQLEPRRARPTAAAPSRSKVSSAGAAARAPRRHASRGAGARRSTARSARARSAARRRSWSRERALERTPRSRRRRRAGRGTAPRRPRARRAPRRALGEAVERAPRRPRRRPRTCASTRSGSAGHDAGIRHAHAAQRRCRAAEHLDGSRGPAEPELEQAERRHARRRSRSRRPAACPIASPSSACARHSASSPRPASTRASSTRLRWSIWPEASRASDTASAPATNAASQSPVRNSSSVRLNSAGTSMLGELRSRPIAIMRSQQRPHPFVLLDPGQRRDDLHERRRRPGSVRGISSEAGSSGRASSTCPRQQQAVGEHGRDRRRDRAVGVPGERVRAAGESDAGRDVARRAARRTRPRSSPSPRGRGRCDASVSPRASSRRCARGGLAAPHLDPAVELLDRAAQGRVDGRLAPRRRAAAVPGRSRR